MEASLVVTNIRQRSPPTLNACIGFQPLFSSIQASSTTNKTALSKSKVFKWAEVASILVAG